MLAGAAGSVRRRIVNVRPVGNPVGGDRKRDRRALEILQSHLNDRQVIGINCSDLIWGLGAIHCLTQQQPAR